MDPDVVDGGMSRLSRAWLDPTVQFPCRGFNQAPRPEARARKGTTPCKNVTIRTPRAVDDQFMSKGLALHFLLQVLQQYGTRHSFGLVRSLKLVRAHELSVMALA